MASKRVRRLDKPIELRQRSISLSSDAHMRARRAILDLSEQGIETTVSGLLEIGVLELLKRKDLAAIMQAHGARSRRR